MLIFNCLRICFLFLKYTEHNDKRNLFTPRKEYQYIRTYDKQSFL